MGAMTEVHWTEIDGVTTVWVDAPPPLRAALMFRTGRADETLANSGRTHLIEHMAMSALGDPTRNQGFVGMTCTGFATMGSPEEVSTFFLALCNALASLPGDRLEAEVQVLKAEGAARPYDVRLNLLTNRFGAMGYGLAGMPEFGLHGVAAEKLRDFIAQRFTRQNAILWLSGPPPAGLRLELPQGEKQPLPPIAPTQEVYPSWFVDDMCRGIAAGAMVPRVPASTIFCEIARNRLHRMLRVERAVSYAPRFSYEHLDADIAHLVLHADSDPARRVELAEAFGEVFEGLKEFDDAEIEAAKVQAHERWVGSLAPPQDQLALVEVNRAAVDWIHGREFRPFEALDADAQSVTAAGLAAFSGEIQRSAMFALPSKLPILPWIGEWVSASSAPLVQGRRIRSIQAPVEHELLIHGSDGVSVLWPNGWHISVHYAELAAALHFEDGGVRLIGRDSSSVVVEPTLWHNGARVSREILERVPEDLLLNLGFRPAEAIPKPTTTALQRMFSTRPRRKPMSLPPQAPCHACGKAVRRGSVFCHHCGAAGPYDSTHRGRRQLSGILVVLGIQLVAAALIMVFRGLSPGALAIGDFFAPAVRMGFLTLGALALRGSERSYKALFITYPYIAILALIFTIAYSAPLGLPCLSVPPIAILDALVSISLYRSQDIADFVLNH
jgi:hypothetical protein